MIPLLTLGPHLGQARRIARGVRLSCRPYVERWGEDFVDPDLALDIFAASLPRITHFDAVTWVPGHDGSPGPGFYAAESLARLWGIPLKQQLQRVIAIPSAHGASERPSWSSTLMSLEATDECLAPNARLLVVDNVIATGANMCAAVSALVQLGYANVTVATCSVDLSAGSSALIHRTTVAGCKYGPSTSDSMHQRPTLAA